MSAKKDSKPRAIVGVAENGNSAVLVTVLGGKVLDRRSIHLTPPGTPTHPHHHEGSWAMGRYLNSPWARPTTLAEAVALVKRVEQLSREGARESLAALAGAVPLPIEGIALRACPELPPTIEERIADNRAQTVADTVMYRQALAGAAQARGWVVHWYERERVLKGTDPAFLKAMGRALGPPWQAKQQLAAAAAMFASV